MEKKRAFRLTPVPQLKNSYVKYLKVFNEVIFFLWTSLSMFNLALRFGSRVGFRLQVKKCTFSGGPFRKSYSQSLGSYYYIE